jgi:type II secretory pathway pseudopilin PulG
MRPCTVLRNTPERGVTLTELMVLLVCMGILAAITAPTFLTAMARQRTNNILTEVRTALESAQQQSMRRGRACEVLIDATANKISGVLLDDSGGATSESCLPTGERNLERISQGLGWGADTSSNTRVATNLPGGKVIFSFKGTNDQAGLVVVYNQNSTIPARCLSLATQTGIMRIGNYAENPPVSALNETLCTVTAQ